MHAAPRTRTNKPNAVAKRLSLPSMTVAAVTKTPAAVTISRIPRRCNRNGTRDAVSKTKYRDHGAKQRDPLRVPKMVEYPAE